MNALATNPHILELGKINAPQLFNQLALVVLDGSGSMKEMTSALITKGDATHMATRELFSRMKAGNAANNFTLAALAFDTTASVLLAPTHCPDIEEHATDFDPVVSHGGATNIGLALAEAMRVIDDFFAKAPADGVPADAVLLLLSDGGENSGSNARDVADRIKATYGKRVTICAALFATVGRPDPDGEQVLKSIVSDPVRGYATVYSGDSLREFFHASLARASNAHA